MTSSTWGGGVSSGETPFVGVRALQVPDATQGVSLPVWVLYPTATSARPLAIHDYPLELAEDAPPLPATSGRRRVVVVSHGNTASPFSLRDVSIDLVRAGFVVVLVEHVGNSRSDKSLTGTVANLENRPRHVRLALDALLADGVLGSLVDGSVVGGLGLSIGAYTVLAAAGGRASTGPYDKPVGPPRRLEITADPRLGPLVLLCPATPWFRDPGSLAAVRGPVLMRTGGQDTLTPEFHAQIVRQNLQPGRLVDDVVVPKAGHFSFLSPFPPAMIRPDFAPAHDPEGFDRRAYAPILHGDVRAFFERTLR
jgi:predicted dienelactone hydrolase